MNQTRVQKLNDAPYTEGGVLYWMDREMRVTHNWSLRHAFDVALEHNVPVGIVYNLVADYLGGGARQYQFKLEGLREVEAACKEKGVPFTVLLTGDTVEDLATFINEQNVGYVVTDMHPLRMNRTWKTELARKISVPLDVVDAHNVVPVWVASEKQEFAARTIRPKIRKHLDTYLDETMRIPSQDLTWSGFPSTDWKTLEAADVDDTIAPTDWKGGETAAKRALQAFIDDRLRGYDEGRNDPMANALSGLSPYFHYGMLSPQFAAQQVLATSAPRADRDTFLEEAVIRRELSDNFCYYNPNYDKVDGFPDWAKKTLDAHRKDERPYVYTRKQFEEARTHDDLWNAAQQEMVKTGKMHGYMRMYWAKKILEWTPDPETALRYAIYLNDRYELDGRDPNGYVGVAWSIGGVHDRAWTERPVYGKIRYMNANGCKRKFDVEGYVAKWVSGYTQGTLNLDG